MSFKHFIRDGWLTASYYAGLSRLFYGLKKQKRGIISYHNVLPVKALSPYDTYNVDITADVFEQQLIFLKKHFRVLPIDELLNAEAQGLFLTVDDGMHNNYEILAPILEKHHLTALFAVCPALIDRQIPYIWRDYLFLLLRQGVNFPILNGLVAINQQTRAFKKYVYDNQVADIYGLIRAFGQREDMENLDNDPLRFTCMTWAQIQDLSARGHQIASHTMTHPVLRFLSEAEKRKELQLSKIRIEEKLKRAVDVLVYPYGSMAEIDQATVNVAQDAGYKMALMNVRQHSLAYPAFTQTRFAFPNSTDRAHLYAIASGYKFLFR